MLNIQTKKIIKSKDIVWLKMLYGEYKEWKGKTDPKLNKFKLTAKIQDFTKERVNEENEIEEIPEDIFNIP